MTAYECMYLISKDEYEASKKPPPVSNLSDISDSHVNNIDVSRGGSVQINSCGKNERLPERREEREEGTTSAKVGKRRGENGGGRQSVARARGRKGARVEREEKAAFPSINAIAPSGGSQLRPLVDSGSGDNAPSDQPISRDPSIPPPPTNLRKRASLNAASIAHRQRELMRDLVDRRLDQLTGKRKRSDPVGDASQLLHNLRDASRLSERRRRTVMEVDPPPPLPASSPRKRGGVMFTGSVVAAKRPKLQRVKRTKSSFPKKHSRSWNDDDDEVPPTKLSRTKFPYLEGHIAGKKRRNVAGIEPLYSAKYSKTLRPEDVPLPPSPPPEEVIIPRPPSPPGHFAGVKRRKSPEEWEYEEYFDPNIRDALPPPKRRPTSME